MNEQGEDKSVLSSIHELAQYNDISVSYELINEEVHYIKFSFY